MSTKTGSWSEKDDVPMDAEQEAALAFFLPLSPTDWDPDLTRSNDWRNNVICPVAIK